MATVVTAHAGRLWCYRARAEADLYEERVFADGVTPGPDAPYTVRAWHCSLDHQCNARTPACCLAQPGDLAAEAPPAR
ncbi:MAG: hypothetical protein JNK29_19460 [Anaerolineales bacterium]|nr:hypothetical protein [Anaerolineales bacterium]